MCLSSYCKTIHHIYFNYHFGESTSRWINSKFTRHFQFALRMFIGFCLSAFIAYGTRLRDRLTLKFMIPGMTILSIKETFGLTLSTNIELMLIIIPLSIYLFIVQNLNLIYHNYLLNEFYYLLSSLIISYKCRKSPTRKLSLLFNSLYFVTIVNQNKIRKYFSFELLEEFIIGIFLSIIISLFIFPLFVTFDIENRVNYCLSHLQKMYHLIIQAYLSEDHITANVFLSRAHIIEKMIRKTMITTQSRFSDTIYEPSRLLKIIFNRKRRFIIDLTIQGFDIFIYLDNFSILNNFLFLQEQEDLTSSLMFNICSLQLIVKQCSFNKYHYDCVKQLKTSLLNLSTCQSLFISSLIPHSSITRHELLNNLTNLQLSYDTVRSSYIETRLNLIKDRFQSSKIIQSEDHLSHSFFLFQ
ncbi:unnamed protein product [Rotaria sp. Silwood2]|nr:unnamed protein product [Rotaria sp. Silwood2]CAF4346648.1 unnamed protein product [Rotaria sp. Silwood2]